MALGLALRELQNIHPVPTVLDRGRIVLSRRSWTGVHPCTYAQGVLSFDLEALDRWYGVNLGGPPGARTPDPLIKSQLLYQLS